MKARYTSKLLTLVIVSALNTAMYADEDKGANPASASGQKIEQPKVARGASVTPPVNVTWSECAKKYAQSVQDNVYGVFDLIWNHEDTLPLVVWSKRAAAITVACITCAKIHEYVISPVVEAVNDATDDEADARQQRRRDRVERERIEAAR